jgi:hypothetical protein
MVCFLKFKKNILQTFVLCILCEAENLSTLQQTADRKAWSLKSEMKFHFCWGIKKSIFKLV